jgi:inositol phosphorylceramide mannosyltransferase catalytic subunit
MIPRLIHQIHLGEPPSQQITDWMASIRHHHPHWEYRLWDEQSIHRDLGIDVATLRYPTHAGKTDLIRLRIVKQFGGVWLDTDIECVKPMDQLLGNRAFTARQSDGKFCNAVFGSVPNHPWLDAQLALAPHAEGFSGWGPEVMTAVSTNGVTIVPTEWFYSWTWDTPPEDQRVHPDAVVVHYWAKSWWGPEQWRSLARP